MSKYVVRSSWKDVPHLSEQQKKDALLDMRPHQKRARTEGIPQVGAGAVYPIEEESITCKPFEIPPEWPKAFALDVGWNRTAALWGAIDKATDTLYIYSEHYLGESPPAVHAQAIRARGSWMQGVVDPASRGRSQDDGERLFNTYTKPIEQGGHGLLLSLADNSVETGLDAVWQRMVRGGIKIFSSCPNFFYEFRLYKRDEKGKIVKVNDHLMDTVRYLCMSGIAVATPTPPAFNYSRSKNVGHKTEFNMFDQMSRESH